MDSYDFIDSIQLEKANALARYKRFNNISKFLRIIEVLFVLALVSYSSTRVHSVFKLCMEYLSALSKQHLFFLVGNMIVIICYFLSAPTGNESADVEILADNKYKHTSHFTSYRYMTQQKTNEVDSVNDFIKPSVEELPEVMQTVVHEKVVEDENANVKTEMVIKKATKEIERFKRTQSVKLRREIGRRELRRSVTERRRGVVVADGGSYSTVESLSNEEFRLAVEAFILKQQRFLRQQTTVEE